MVAGRYLAAAIRGAAAVDALTPEEEIGFMIMADLWQCLGHLRSAYSKDTR